MAPTRPPLDATDSLPRMRARVGVGANAVRENLPNALPNPRLLIISDRSQATRPIVEIAEAAFSAGCRWFSLREKDLPAAERRRLLRALVALGRRYEATVMLHEDVDAAVAAGAGGVHLPGGGDPAAARRRLPAGLIGVSAHTPEEAAAQLKAGADYVTLSPIFLTASKPGYGPAVGLAALAAAARRASGPVVALGGIDAENIAACLAAGARGIAVMGEVMRAADPEAAVRCLIAAME
jgi:thiamine-phosphate pyrophosphorylase